jgi:predicted RNase H-like nuclease (RuvC/YqgF family)
MSQQEGYDYIKQLEEKDSTKISAQANVFDQVPFLVHSPIYSFQEYEETYTIERLKEEIRELEVLDNHIKQENQTLKEKNQKMLGKIERRNKKNAKLKETNNRLRMKIINLKAKILMEKPKQAVTRKKTEDSDLSFKGHGVIRNKFLQFCFAWGHAKYFGMGEC